MTCWTPSLLLCYLGLQHNTVCSQRTRLKNETWIHVDPLPALPHRLSDAATVAAKTAKIKSMHPAHTLTKACPRPHHKAVTSHHTCLFQNIGVSSMPERPSLELVVVMYAHIGGSLQGSNSGRPPPPPLPITETSSTSLLHKVAWADCWATPQTAPLTSVAVNCRMHSDAVHAWRIKLRLSDDASAPGDGHPWPP